jgi:hypothetical protein
MHTSFIAAAVDALVAGVIVPSGEGDRTGVMINRSKARRDFRRCQGPSRGSMTNAKMTRAEKAMTPSVMKNVSMNMHSK